VPEVSVETVRRLLAMRGTSALIKNGGGGDDGLLRAARTEQHKLAATLLSLWEREDKRLIPALSAELTAHRERLEIYRATWEKLAKLAPEASFSQVAR
jgi:hypothetical protein